MLKLSKRHPQFHKLSKRADNKKVREMKDKVKKDPVVVKKFKEYGIPLSDIDKLHVEFCPLDVSAKTKNRKIYINERMLADDGQDPTHYLVHELMHYLQQTTGKNRGGEANDYLDKPTEQEAFEAQIDYKKREESPEEAEEYTEGLLDHHDIDGEERKEKKEELMDLD